MRFNNQTIKKTLVAIITIFSMFATGIPFINVSATENGVPATANDAAKMLASLINQIFKLAFYVGVLLLAYGAIQIILAFKNEDGESKLKATITIIMAIVFITLGSLFSPVLELFGITVS